MNFVTSWGGYGRPCGSHDTAAATPVRLTLHRFRLIPVRSPLLGESRFLFVPAGTEMFQFPAFLPLTRFREMNPGRFPDLRDLRIIACKAASRSLSQLYHVFHQLWTPRHPPYTLSSLTTLFVLEILHSCFCHLHSRFTLFSKNLRTPSSEEHEALTHSSFSARAPCAGGGGEGTRTHDPLVANQVLYQLSYAPMIVADDRVTRPFGRVRFRWQRLARGDRAWLRRGGGPGWT
jgi:hypothetical protein